MPQPCRDNRSRLARRTWQLLGAVVGAVLVLLLGGYLIMIRMPNHSYVGAVPPLAQTQTQLAEQLRASVYALTGFGPRHFRRPDALHASQEWLRAELTHAGYEVELQTFDVAGTACSNLAVEKIGRNRPEEIVVIGAHYDTEPATPGADDNASGVAALLALSRHFASEPTDRTLRFVAFVNEEMPHFTTQSMGSMHAARRSRERGEDIRAMISLESIGYFSTVPGSQKYPPPLSLLYPDRGDFIGFVANVESRKLVRQAIGSFRARAQIPSEGAAIPGVVPGISWSDHSSYWSYEYPAIMVTDTAPFRNPHYHRPSDTADTVDYLRLTHVVLGMQAVIEELVAAEP